MQEMWVQSLGQENPSWRRKWQPTPVCLPGKSHGQRSLPDYGPWGHKRIGHDLATNQSQQFFPVLSFLDVNLCLKLYLNNF